MGGLWVPKDKKQENEMLDRRFVGVSDWAMSIASILREKLWLALAPQELDVSDDSAKHAGHAGAKPGGETHFSVRIVSTRFEGLNRLQRQRLVYAALSDEIRTQVHALSLTTLTPAEASSR